MEKLVMRSIMNDKVFRKRKIISYSDKSHYKPSY